MKTRPGWKAYVVSLLLLAIFSSCHKNGSSGWNTQMLVPLVNSTLTIQNLINDTTKVKVNSDSSLTIAYQSTLYQFNLANEIVQIPDTSIGQVFTLDSLALPSNTIAYNLTLGTLAENLIQSGGANAVLGNGLIAENNTSTTLPALGPLSTGGFSFNAAGYYDSARIKSGSIQVWVVNHLPIPINAGAVISLYNAGNPNPVVTYTTTQALCAWNTQCPGTADSIFFAVNISNCTFITDSITMAISNLSTPGSGGADVLVDTSNYIQMRMYLNNLHVCEAWAIFPNQSVVNQTEDVTVQFADRKLTFIQAKSGKLHISVYNSVPQPLYLQYTLVGAYNNLGKPLVEYTTVPPLAGGVPGQVNQTIDISGYSINLTGHNGSEFNTYTQNVVANIVSNGTTQHITLSDSLNIKYELDSIAPSYIKGYVGRDTVLSAGSAAFSFLNMFKSGSINLQNVNMNFTAVNGIGVSGQVKLNSLKAVSANNGSQILSGPVIGQPLNIQPATDFPLTASINSMSLNSSNSNIQNLLNILPDSLYYNVRVQTNVNGNNQQYRQFAYLQSTLDVNLNAEIPLSLLANNLTLQDTIGFNLSNTNTSLNGVTGGTFNVIVENKFPISANLTMIVYDSSWAPVDILINNGQVAAAPLDNNCRVDQAMQTVLQTDASPAAINNLKKGRFAVITASFSTQSSNTTCNGQHLKIYSDYSLGVTLSAQFTYNVKTNL